MKKEYISLILNSVAMALIALSRHSFDWIAIGALIIMSLSLGRLFILIRKS